jgi:hypothetical protein
MDDDGKAVKKFKEEEGVFLPSLLFSTFLILSGYMAILQPL